MLCVSKRTRILRLPPGRYFFALVLRRCLVPRPPTGLGSCAKHARCVFFFAQKLAPLYEVSRLLPSLSIINTPIVPPCSFFPFLFPPSCCFLLLSQTYPPSQTKVISDVDLCSVSFDDTGVIRSYAYGLMVELVYAIEDLVS